MRSTTTILVSLYSGLWQRASAVARPKTPEPTIMMEEGIRAADGDMVGGSTVESESYYGPTESERDARDWRG